MKRRLLYNQRSPLVVRRENAALTHEAKTSIQPEETPKKTKMRTGSRSLTSGLRTGSQQVDDIEIMSDVNENLQLRHQGAVLARRGSL